MSRHLPVLGRLLLCDRRRKQAFNQASFPLFLDLNEHRVLHRAVFFGVFFCT